MSFVGGGRGRAARLRHRRWQGTLGRRQSELLETVSVGKRNWKVAVKSGKRMPFYSFSTCSYVIVASILGLSMLEKSVKQQTMPQVKHSSRLQEDYFDLRAMGWYKPAGLKRLKSLG